MTRDEVQAAMDGFAAGYLHGLRRAQKALTGEADWRHVFRRPDCPWSMEHTALAAQSAPTEETP